MKYIILLICFMTFASCQEQQAIKKSYLTTDTIHYADSSYEFVTFMGGLRTGVSRLHKNGYTYTENLYIRNHLLVQRRFYSGDQGHARKILYNIGDTLWPIGVIWYDKHTLEKKQLNALYFEVLAEDTVEYGDSIKMKIIGNLGTSKRFNMKLELGQMFPSGQLLVESTYTSDSTELVLKVGDLKDGVNLITGHLHYYFEGEEITNKYMDYNLFKIIPPYEYPYIFYHQFYVKPKIK